MNTSEGATFALSTRAKKKRASFISSDQKRTRSTIRLVRSERRTTSIWPRESGAFSKASLCCQQADRNNVAPSAASLQLFKCETSSNLRPAPRMVSFPAGQFLADQFVD